MLVAALLFAVGIWEGWRYRASVLMASSMLVTLAWLALWVFVWAELDAVKVLLLFAYLTAHQAGYLVGAHLSADIDPRR
ncbi:hypothetical protein MOTC310_03120 [Methylobacterium oryzae]|uniref:Uncharacterized protein n=2 Tax=Methylobacterium oryzae TaxID=334852 RepID=A0ABU7TIY2_9HYPH